MNRGYSTADEVKAMKIASNNSPLHVLTRLFQFSRGQLYVVGDRVQSTCNTGRSCGRG
jgi:hypothetical protein